ncbi:MAG TPA: hypothetical protein VGN60_12015 [Devosia sp.]|jgi:NADH-quinone oxidoreductase subunit E|nr:hypothetical protein [Devosia sp.]
MTNLAHIAETALLLLSAYLFGCIVGYGLRRVLHAARGTRQTATAPVPVAPAVVEPRRVPSAAARLAARVEDLPPSLPKLRPATTSPDGVVVAAVAGVPREGRPMQLTVPRGGAADNLKQIEGIGPKIEASLYALGIFHLGQIAGWSKADIAWVDAQLAFKGRILRERWVEQARELSRAVA